MTINKDLIDIFYALAVTIIELVIVTSAQYICFGTKRIDKSFAVLAVIQLTHSSIISMQYFEYDSLGYTEMALGLVTIFWYVQWAFIARAVHNALEQNPKMNKFELLKKLWLAKLKRESPDRDIFNTILEGLIAANISVIVSSVDENHKILKIAEKAIPNKFYELLREISIKYNLAFINKDEIVYIEWKKEQ